MSDQKQGGGLNVAVLQPYAQRRFVPEGVELTDAGQVKGLYERLLERPIGSSGELREWLRDRSELEAALAQAEAVLYIRMTCQTDDAERAGAYQNYVQTVEPVVEPLADRLNEKYLEARGGYELEAREYEVYDRAVRADVELFRQENVDLQTQEKLLTQEYQKVTGAITIEFEGKEYTPQQMAKFQEETDRGLRERAWRATAGRRLAEKERLDGILDQLLGLRGRIAKNADCRDYIEYKFRQYHRFDYGPEDCKRYHEAAERVVVPVLERLGRERRERMGLDRLRPWDLGVDPAGRGPLRPFEGVTEFVRGIGEMFSQTDPELGAQFAEMAAKGLLDLESRKGKAPGGYQHTLAEARKPFIFMNAVGTNRDVRTLLHEGGHAFHAFASAGQELYPYRHAPMEFCEVASMGMDLLAAGELGAFYEEADARRSHREHLESIVAILAWVATIDAFQFWLYEHPGHTAEERGDAWLAVRRRFAGGQVDWSGLEAEHRAMWQAQLHIYQVPFYYIEYGIAQMGALQLWLRAKEDAGRALGDYRAALALGGSRPLPELFERAGLRFDFSAGLMAKLMAAVSRELDSLEG